MKFTNSTISDVGIGPIRFRVGYIEDLGALVLSPETVRAISAAVAAGQIAPFDTEAQQLIGLSSTNNSQFGIPVNPNGGAATLVPEVLSGTRDGVNTTFTATKRPNLVLRNGVPQVSLADGSGNTADITVTDNVVEFTVPPTSTDSLIAYC